MTLPDGFLIAIANRLGIGEAAAKALPAEILTLIDGTQGGFAGFLDRFRHAGLGAAVSGWLGRAEIPAAAEPLLRTAATRLRELPAGTRVEVAGYTDNTGDPASNLQLSEQRAAAVRDFLIKAGPGTLTLTARGHGAANPVAPNDTPEGRFRNRRIEYHLTPP